MPTTASPRQIRDDFDVIAQLSPERQALGPLEGWLLASVPAQRESVLEIGCGVGNLSRRLAPLFDRVVAIDLSPGMLAEARRRTPPDMAIQYACADMFDWLSDAPNAYDCIVTVATLHHVDLSSALRAMSRALKPGGRLLVIDLCTQSPLMSAVAWPVALVREVLVNRRLTPLQLRRAYWRHGRNETYLSLPEVKRAADAEVPGATMKGHLLWRYSLLWEKPNAAPHAGESART